MPLDENTPDDAVDTKDDFSLDAAIDSISEKVTGETSVEAEPDVEAPPKAAKSGPEDAAPAAEKAPVLGETAPAAPAEAQEGIKASEIKPLPKSWKKDMAGHWEKLPPEVHEYVYAREADVMRGIQQYQTGYKMWEATVKPFIPIFQQAPDLNPVELFQNLFNTHLQLSRGTPEQKQALAQKLLSDYGIDLAPQAEGEVNPLQREVLALRNELQSLKSGFTETQNRTYQAAVAEQRKTVDAFFSDPKNEFAEELQGDILRLIQTGAAGDLPSAYEQACWLNPGVRAKMLAKQQAAAAQTTAKPAGNFPNVDSDPKAKARSQQRRQTMDDTINGVVAKYTNLQ